ncbi:MAG: 4-hydroxy-3-methylbut-2-enyl diphosphate reductase [Pseudomonadota bacterium]
MASAFPTSTAGATNAEKPALKVLLAAPRGFCAGVDRAIHIVELALEKYGKPVYVRHEIVHNRHVVERLEQLGAIFVEELEEAPSDRPIIFSAHGVPKSVPAEADAREMIYIDATCPLVSKVHVEADRLYAEGREILLIGHDGHPEVVGTMGQLPQGAIRLVETVEDAEALQPRDPDRLAFITQTTLSVDDTAEIVDALTRRFPSIRSPHKEDICYATSNRQAAVKAIAERCDVMLVIGAPNSSNSVRLVEVAERAGCPQGVLVERADRIDWAAFGQPASVGVTAGASAPETLVQEVLDGLRARFDISIEEVEVTREDVVFKAPRMLAG